MEHMAVFNDVQLFFSYGFMEEKGCGNKWIEMTSC